MLARCALIVCAVVVLAWMLVGLHDARDLDRGSAQPKGDIADLITSLKTPGQFAPRIALLRSARVLTPDTRADLVIAGDYQLRHGPGDLSYALRVAQSVVRREPQNLDAWIVVLKIQQFRFDHAGVQSALAQIRRLDPLAVRRS